MSHLLRMASVSLTIFHLTDINTFVLDKDRTVLLSYEHNHLPDFLFDIQQKNFSFLLSETVHHPNECCLYTNEAGLSYLATLFQLSGDRTKVLVNGPFLQQIPDIFKLNTSFKIDAKKRIVLKEFYQGLKLISTSRIQSIANVLQKISSINQTPIHILKEGPVYSEEPPIYTNLEQPDERYVRLIELRYEFEHELMHAIRRGDKQKLLEVLSKWKNFYDFSDVYPNRPVRAMKNRLITLNTTLRIAAEQGEVHPFFLHHVTEKFALQIESIESIDGLNLLLVKMCEEYCELVRAHSVYPFSPIVQKAINLMTIHFTQPLHLENLAKYCLVHPAHLSRQFKKETGMTLTNYLHKIRIDEAKNLLRASEMSIDSIAGKIGFDDAGYFSRIFKKREGMTPSQYRNSR